MNNLNGLDNWKNFDWPTQNEKPQNSPMNPFMSNKASPLRNATNNAVPSLAPCNPYYMSLGFPSTGWMLSRWQPLSWITVKYIDKVHVLRVLFDRFESSVHADIGIQSREQETLTCHETWIDLITELIERAGDTERIFNEDEPSMERHVDAYHAAASELTHLTMTLEPVFGSEFIHVWEHMLEGPYNWALESYNAATFVAIFRAISERRC